MGQPGEPTTSKANTLTSNGISSLLNSEFAKEDTATPPGQETPPAGETVAADHAAAEEMAETAETAEAVVAAENALPPEMQAALDEWEAKGGALPDSVQRVVNKRIGRLTADKETEKGRADRAEAAFKTLQAEAEGLRNDPQRPAQPAATGIIDETVLAKTEKAAKTFLDEAEAYLDDTANEQERGRIERMMATEGLDANALKRRVREINGYLRDELPEQKKQVAVFRTQENQFNAQADRDFTWLSDANAPEQKVRAEMLKLLPDLPKRLPNHKMIMGIYMLGFKAYEQQLAANGTGKPATSKNPPPKTPAGNGATRTAAVKGKPGDAATAAFSKAPTRENAVNLALAALREG